MAYSATAHALPAFAENGDAEGLIRHLQPVTPTAKTIGTVAMLRAELGCIRQSGYALSIDQLADDVSRIAAPVMRDDECCYALALAAPTARPLKSN